MSDQYLMRALGDLADQYTEDGVLEAANAMWPRKQPSTPSRTADPHTSLRSGDRNKSGDVTRFSVSSRSAKLLRAIAHHGGLTAQEATNVVMTVGCSMSSFDGCRRRVSDLLLAEFIEDSGTTRRNPGSPDESIVWRVTMAGQRALRLLDTTGWSNARRVAVAS